MNENSESLIGPSGMEILKQEIDGLEKFKKSRMEERYRNALKGLAYRWFEIKNDEFDQLKPKQITALEILANKKTKRNLKIWGWTNVAFIVGVGIANFLISPFFSLVLLALLLNVMPGCDLKDDLTFQTEARELNKKFNPQLMLKTNKKEEA